MNQPVEHAQQEPPRVSRVGAIAGGGLGAHRVLNIEQAAEFLHLHPVTLQRMAKRREVPAAKLGRRWIFLEIDLVAYLRAQYPSRVMRGEHKEVKLCRSTDAKILPSGGSSCTTAEKSYREALGLPKR
ncbi:MAG: helix-turn-helix domain-containing protein [Nitrosomonadales bacterium]|nr:helix-turn-helix domain-containing protein [Nitrosomonadales bacterium]